MVCSLNIVSTMDTSMHPRRDCCRLPGLAASNGTKSKHPEARKKNERTKTMPQLSCLKES
jgi:hypothetical protein